IGGRFIGGNSRRKISGVRKGLAQKEVFLARGTIRGKGFHELPEVLSRLQEFGRILGALRFGIVQAGQLIQIGLQIRLDLSSTLTGLGLPEIAINAITFDESFLL